MRTRTGKFLTAIILLGGVVLRFYYQFLEWSFNGDEVNLGLDIINHTLGELFYPFQNRQSAPPLFLLTQKILSNVAQPYISLKILTFLSSCASIFLFNRILKRSFPLKIGLILLALFCFNPFIISNSLTLKQYSIDLMMGLVAVSFFSENKKRFITFSFFGIFCLISNVGLFFSASLIIFNLIKSFLEKNGRGLINWKTLKLIFPYILAPIPYLIFYIWFLHQPGAEVLKNYMVNYWSAAFMPLDFGIVKWLAIQAKVLMIFFFSTYWFLGLPMLLLFLYGAFIIVKRKKELFQHEHFVIILIFTFTALIHVLLSALKIYPFSDRLFLYLAPVIYLIIGIGIQQLNKKKYSGLNNRIAKSVSLIIPICAIVFYLTYLPSRSNNVYDLIKFVNSTDGIFVLTPKAKQLTQEWMEFTQYDEQDIVKLVQFNELQGSNETQGNFIIAVQGRKFGHKVKLSTQEPVITKLEEKGKIALYRRFDGYSIYIIK